MHHMQCFVGLQLWAGAVRHMLPYSSRSVRLGWLSHCLKRVNLGRVIGFGHSS